MQAPAVLILAFLPMLFIAASYYYMNRADPDCGTTFSWVTRAMGPWSGWIGGWAIIVADVIVMANLAQIADLYGFLLFDWQSAADSTFAVTLFGIMWIALMTAICVYGIELSARTQIGLLSAEVITLALFAVVALVKVYGGDAGPGAVEPDLGWFSPFAIDSIDGMTTGLLIAVFIYWGWDSTVTVNDETRDSGTTPGRAAIPSTIILVGIYVLVAAAAVAFAGPERIAGDESGDALGLLGTEVLGVGLDKLVIIAVLTSAAASMQTTILPTARTSLSMARAGAMPERLKVIHPSARAAAAEALRLAGELGAGVVFAFAYWTNPGGEVADMLAALRERGTELLQAALAEAEQAGVAAALGARPGPPECGPGGAGRPRRRAHDRSWSDPTESRR